MGHSPKMLPATILIQSI